MKLTERPDLVYYAKMAQRRVGYIAGQLELTSKCEQLCPNCDSWKAHQDGRFNAEMPFAKIIELWDQLNEMNTFEHLAITGGDPVSHPFFYEVLRLKRRFKLQVNTAMPLPLRSLEKEVWHRADSIRLSLDGVDKPTYYKMRGVHTDPEEVIARMEEIAHPFWATNTCVADANVEKMPHIVARLAKMRNPPRRANFLAVLDRKTSPDFWRKYREMTEYFQKYKMGVETSVAEDVKDLRDYLGSGMGDEIPCYSGAVTFHIKCNGGVYPCCLTGGEAIVTRPEFEIGNVFNEPLEAIRMRYVPKKDYKGEACRSICQWKQFQLNRLAHEASKIHMRMP